jgi:phospholipid/cholesterol/gamma-HCH transport system permease protein
MREWAEFTIAEAEDGARGLVLTGPLIVSSIGRLDASLRGSAERFAHIDLSQVGEVDTVGAWTVWRLARDSGADIVGASDKARRLIAAVHRNELDEGTAPRAHHPIRQRG